MRDLRMSLDGSWEFVHTSRSSGAAEVRLIEVPGPWQAQFKDLRMRGGVAVYRRRFEISTEWLTERVFIRFGAVFHRAEVSINGSFAGRNDGGFLPFAFDITDVLVAGVNEIEVKVESPTDDVDAFPDSPLTEIPFGKQSWYGPLSGIWQSVWLEQRVADHFARIRIQPDLDSKRVEVVAFLAHRLALPSVIRFRVLDQSGTCVVKHQARCATGLGEHAAELDVPDVKAWSPDDPQLYRLEATIWRGGREVERLERSFGFRNIEAKGGRLFLNGEPIYLRGALDQDYYPEMICTTPSVEVLEDQFRKAKELGLNCLRCHIKAADPRYYDAADRIGLLIWTELPNGGLATVRSRARKEATLKGIVDRDGHHPSIIIWTVINENWGVDLVHDAEHRDWLRRTYHWLKSYDPGRLVVDNSPLAPSFHVETDIADYHFYAACPDNRAAWDGFVRSLADRADWLYSPEGDAVQTGQEPLICSEFGNWGLPYPDKLKNDQGDEPWWFETGHDWGEGVMYAHGVENRFLDWSLDRVFGSLEGFVEAAQWQQFRALKYQIEAMRREPKLAGYVITEFTDVHWESNGLLDMRRNRRVFHEVFHTVNSDTLVVPQWERLAYWAGESAQFGLAVAHGAGPALDGASLEIFLGDSQIMKIGRVDPASVLDLGTCGIRVPEVNQPCIQRLALELRSNSGAIIATNHLDVAIYPERRNPDRAMGHVWAAEAELGEYLEALGYQMASEPQHASLIVATRHDSEIAARVREGARLLLLPETEMSLNPFFPHWQAVKVLSRKGTPWQGDWASSFSCLRRGGRFASIPGGPLLDETLDRIIPTHVINGCNLIDFQARVHASMVIGWVHKPVALAVERSYGKGRVLVSTLRLFRDAPKSDPAAATVLDTLVSQTLGIDGSGVAGALLVTADVP